MVKYFCSFKFDDATATLVRGQQAVPLTRKAGELLRCLIDHAGSSVPHKTILSTVWPNTHVQPDNVKVLVRELRRALGDDARQPRFIRSFPARGYAFIASAAHAPGPVLEQPEPGRPVMFVNRHEELRALTRALDLASAAPCRLVLVEGESGVGKTALCDEFIQSVGRRHDVRVAYGQCIDQVASSHPYYPVVAALNHLLRHSPEVLAAFERRAPGWSTLLQNPASWRESAGAGRTPESMACELVAAFADSRRTTVLVVEDLHWTDADTVELLRALGRRTERLGLVVVATCAPYASTPAAPLLRQLAVELQAGSERLRLLRLTAAAVRRYLVLRFETEALDRLARPLYATTQGHPFCVVAALDALISAGHLRESETGWCLDLPSRLLEPVLSRAVLSVLSRLFDRLDEQDRSLLQAAAAVGVEFSLSDLGRALDAEDLAAVGCRLDGLVERGFVLSSALGDSDVDYRFPHACHAEALLVSTTPFHQLRVAQRLAAVDRVTEPPFSLEDS